MFCQALVNAEDDRRLCVGMYRNSSSDVWDSKQSADSKDSKEIQRRFCRFTLK